MTQIETRYHARLYTDNQSVHASTEPTTSESAARRDAKDLSLSYGMKIRHDGWYVKLIRADYEVRMVYREEHDEGELLYGEPPAEPEWVPPQYQD